MSRNPTDLTDQLKQKVKIMSQQDELYPQSPRVKPQSVFQDRLNNKLMTFGFGLALLLLFGAAIGFGLAMRQLKKEQQWVEHTYKVIEQIDDTLSGMSNSERGRRGYVITQDSIYLKTYEAGIKKVNKGIENLQELTADSPQQQQRINTIKELFKQRLLISEKSLKLLQNSSENLIQITLTNQGKEVQDQIEILLNDMEESERQLLSQRQKDTSNRIYQIGFIVGVGYFLSFSLLLIIYRQLKQQIHHRQQAEQDLSQINELLEIRIEERTAELTQLNTILRNEIEERKQLEQLLRESEERFRQAIFEAPLPIIIHAEDGEILQINWAWSESSGYQPEDIPTMSAWCQKVYPDDHETIKAYTRQLFELNQRIAEGEYTLTNRQGKSLVWDYYSAPLKTLADGRKVRITMALDVTKRKQAELALCASEHRYSTLTELAPVGIFRTDSNGNCVYVNQQWCQIAGLIPQQAMGTRWMSALHPEDRQTVVAEWVRSVTNHSLFNLEYRLQSPQGKITWVVGQAIAETTPQGEIIGYIGTITDISERKQAEQALRLSEERFRRGVVNAPVPMMIHAEDGTVLDISQAWTDITGYTLEEIPTIADWTQKAYGSKQQQVRADIERLYNLPQPLSEGEYIIKTKRGETRVWEFYSASLGKLSDGRRSVISTALDVTERKQAEQDIKKAKAELEIRVAERTAELKAANEQLQNDIIARKQAEEALQQNEAKFRFLCESSPIGIFLMDIQGQVLYTNPRYQEIVGATAEEVLGEGWKQFIHPEDHQTIVSDWLANLGQQQNSFYPEVRFEHKNGNIRYGQVYTSAIFTEQNKLTGFVGTVEDITERRQIEQMKKDFISVVSHELRTPLTAIHGSLGLLAAGVYDNKPEKAKKMIKIAAGQTDRLVRLVSDILDLGRLESGNLKLVMQSCKATTLMQQAIEVMRPQAEENQITLSVIPLDVPVWADFDAIIQTLTNLLSNAIKFSDPNSTIVLKAELMSLDDKIEVWQRKRPSLSLLSRPYVLFQVQDQGRGIPANKLDLIFEKFQQIDASDSREKGGTGLGLAICRTIIEQHRGQIWAESVLGEGSIFYFTLPLSAEF